MKVINTISRLWQTIKYIIHHTPNDELNEDELEAVKNNGLVHFCRKTNVDNIITNGVIPGPNEMNKSEKGCTWFYIYDEGTCYNKLDAVRSRGDRYDYDACVIIKELSDEQLNKLRIRRKIDGAVMYPGTMLTHNMEKKLFNE